MPRKTAVEVEAPEVPLVESLGRWDIEPLFEGQMRATKHAIMQWLKDFGGETSPGRMMQAYLMMRDDEIMEELLTVCKEILELLKEHKEQ